MPARILILTTGHLSRNPRVVKEATTLGQNGYDVTIVGVRNSHMAERADAQIVATAPFRNRSLNLLPGSGWHSFRERLEVRFRRTLAHRFGWHSIGSLGPSRALLAAAASTEADLTICHNELGLWAGTELLANTRLVAADIEDWHSEDLLPSARKTRPLALLRRIEQKILCHAQYTTTTSNSLADGIHREFGGKLPEVITNSFPLGPVRSAEENESPRILWFSQTIGPGRGLENFLSDWSESQSGGTVTLVGSPVSDTYLESLRGSLPDCSRNRLIYRKYVNPSELPGLIASYDVGLALEPKTPRNKDLTISNKILQYLNAGLAIFATPTQGQREVLSYEAAAGCLLHFNKESSELSLLRSILADQRRLKSMQRASRRLAAARYCWEREEPRLLELVSRALRQAGVKR